MQIWHRPPKNAPRDLVNETVDVIMSVPIAPKSVLKEGDATDRLMNLSVNYNLHPSMHWSRQANMYGIANDHQYLEKSLYETTVDGINFADEKMVENLEKATRDQNESKTWFNARRSRLTASRIKEVITAMETAQKKNLPCSIIPARFNFRSSNLQRIPAIAWGTTHEKYAFRDFTNQCKNSKIYRKCGIYVDIVRHYLAASPDGISECGSEIMEIKCPYKIRYNEPERAQFLDSNGMLKQNHNYYYQVQTQMHVTRTKICNFIIFTTKGLHTQVIQYDEDFMNRILPILDFFYKHVFCEEYCKTFGF